MSVWFVIPSKRPAAEANACLGAWHAMGYHTAVAREAVDGEVNCSLLEVVQEYMGWPASVNHLAKIVLEKDSSCLWIVTGGDDYWPDPLKGAEEIAGEASAHFSGTFGVMQPTGDPWSDSQGRIIERIAGSPWLGREWCRRAYGGNGPLPPYYFHNYADEELQHVAKRLGVFWQRPDLVQQHKHWFHTKDKPAWWDSKCGADYNVSAAVFRDRLAHDCPGHEPLD